MEAKIAMKFGFLFFMFFIIHANAVQLKFEQIPGSVTELFKVFVKVSAVS